jgi:hypothetical protein
MTFSFSRDAGTESLILIEAHQQKPACETVLTVAVSQGRARRSDPSTSHRAAQRAERFASGHYALILAGLRQAGTATAHELSPLVGLSVVQIDRRLPELERAGRARVITQGGIPLTRGGFRVWEAVGA